MFELGVIAVITAMVATVMFGALIEKLTRPNPELWVKRVELEEAEALIATVQREVNDLKRDVQFERALRRSRDVQHVVEINREKDKQEREVYIPAHIRRERLRIGYDNVSMFHKPQAG